jgi:hypothetical protein
MLHNYFFWFVDLRAEYLCSVALLVLVQGLLTQGVHTGQRHAELRGYNLGCSQRVLEEVVDDLLLLGNLTHFYLQKVM